MNIGLVAPLNVSHCCLTRETLFSFLSKKMIALRTYTDYENSRSMRHTLASAILGLLTTRMIYEDADLPLPPTNTSALRREADSLLEPPLDVLLDRPGESLFERLLCVLHALLGSCKPSWLKSRSSPKPSIKTQRDFSAFDTEAAEGLQVSSSHSVDC
jgi:hypothetical protein